VATINESLNSYFLSGTQNFILKLNSAIVSLETLESKQKFFQVLSLLMLLGILSGIRELGVSSLQRKEHHPYDKNGGILNF
jgi:hypothetical protein